MAEAEHQQLISALFEHEINTASSLLDILRQEHAALAGNDIPAIEQAVAGKQPLASRLDMLIKQHEEILRAAGYSTNPAGIESYIRDQDPYGIHHLSPTWGKLRALSAACQQQNQVNGAVIAISRLNLQRALSILRGHPPESESCYSATGATQPKSRAQSLGRA